MPFANSKIAGTLLLVGGAQFVIALIIAEAIYPGYSVASNYISDLGVWSNSALVFNSSIIIFGLTVLASSYFINKQFKNRTIAVFFALAGAGSLGVGVFPENTFISKPYSCYPQSFSALGVCFRRNRRNQLIQNYEVTV